MTASPVFGIEASDLLAKLMPIVGAGSFSIGDEDGDDLTTAAAEDIIAIAEDRVLSSLPERYRSLMRSVDGEVVVRSAQDGQTTFSTGLKPVVAGTLRIYINFPGGAWSERERLPMTDGTPARGTRFPLADSEFALTAATGAVVLDEPLETGDRVVVCYDHAGATGMKWFRDLALTYAAIEIARRFAYFRSADGYDRFQAWNVDADLWLKNFARGAAPGLDAIDRLELMRETRGKKLSQILKIGRF
jgi:hypothetical protein